MDNKIEFIATYSYKNDTDQVEYIKRNIEVDFDSYLFDLADRMKFSILEAAWCTALAKAKELMKTVGYLHTLQIVDPDTILYDEAEDTGEYEEDL